MDQLSYSYWQRLNGVVRRVVADSAIKGLYHISSYIYKDDKYTYSYALFENGKLTEFVTPLSEAQRRSAGRLVEAYENVRNLERFDPNHCPIMEFVTFGKKDYFLQYHRGRDFEPATFTLDRDPIRGETKAFFVRGATSEEGMNCSVTVVYPWTETGKARLLKREDGSFDIHLNSAFSEIMVRRRKLQIINSDGDMFNTMGDFVEGHQDYSRLIKPKVSVIQDIWKIIPRAEFHTLLDQDRDKRRRPTIELQVVSDGRLAYLKRI